IIMKKGRPAIKLTILAKQNDIKALQTIVFSETTSIGMRMYPVEKVKIERKYVVVETSYGPISLKKAYFEGSCVNVKPEYEQIKKFAIESGLPVKHVYQDILSQINGHK
ncbi:MAG TPA: nickel insertion protein, partial [Fusibacter sp.]|nr:nickel insertion protein [Fusibacter sp.]